MCKIKGSNFKRKREDLVYLGADPCSALITAHLSCRETIYGRMWYFTSDFSRGDTAYTKLALDRHTDTTYFQEPCGYVLLLLLHMHSAEGRRDSR